MKPTLFDIDMKVFVDWKAGVQVGGHADFTVPVGGRPTLFMLARHGETKLNKSTEDSTERVRGWKDIPLDENGKKDAVKLAYAIRKAGIQCIYSSDLERAAETARIVNKVLRVPLTLIRGLRPWNVGDFTGQETKVVGPKMEALALHRPDEKAPGGESFNQFKDRTQHAIEDLLADHRREYVLVVTHHRVERLCAAWQAEQK